MAALVASMLMNNEKHILCEQFLHSFKPQITLTRSGRPAIICSHESGDDIHPLMGVYHNGESWIPIRWTKDGTFHNNSTKTGIDVVLVDVNLEPEAV